MENISIEQYLKKLRKACNYSQEFVASHLNITRQTYSHYETGRITPPVNSLYNLAKLYGVPVENFLELVVTYNINMDFAIPPRQDDFNDSDELNSYLQYIGATENSKKFRYLDRKERLLLYYFHSLDARDQNDIISFMKIKKQNRENEQKKTANDT